MNHPDDSALDQDYLSPHDYQLALDSQTACNLSGIVHAFSAVLSKIWRESRREGSGTLGVNEHPICRLYAEQISHLSGAGLTSDTAGYSKAYKICQERSQAKVSLP